MFDLEFSGLSNFGKALDLGQRLQTMAAHKVQEQIRTFSQQHMMTPDGNTFERLTPAYKRRKERMGRPGIPNLTLTGGYMREMKPRKVGDDLVVGPNEADEGKAKGLSKKRHHIGVAPETPGIIEAEMPQYFERSFQ